MPTSRRLAIAAARLIGDGFYGLDLKQNASGVHVIKINDNPNLDVGAEDKVLGDHVYRRLPGHLLAKFEARNEPLSAPAGSLKKPVPITVSARLLSESIALQVPAVRANH